MEVQLGIPSLYRGFLAGVVLTTRSTLTRERSLRTVSCRIRSIFIMLVREYSKPRTAGRHGQNNLADKSRHSPFIMLNFSLFPAKLAISFLLVGLKLASRPRGFTAQWTGVLRGQLFP